MRILNLLAGLALLAAPAAADALSLKDGRFVHGRPITKTADGYLIRYEKGEVLVPEALVANFYRVSPAGDYVPTTEEEKRKFEKGYIRFEGKWLRAAQVEKLRKKLLADRQKRLVQAKERRLWRNHVVVKTKRFEFHHTLPDEVFEEFQSLFETYFDVFTKYWKSRPAADFGRARISIYHDQEYFLQVTGMQRGVLGYYMPSERDLHFFYDRENKSFTIDVMFHEGNHLLTHMISEDMWYPWWISEGLAEYFGAAEWDPEKKKMELGKLQSGRLAVIHIQIKEDKRLKLDDLLNNRETSGIGYAWAWSFSHFLLHTPKYAKRYKKFYLGIDRDKNIKRVQYFSRFKTVKADECIRAFLRYIKAPDVETLQKEWWNYIDTELSLKRAKIDWGQAGLTMSRFGEEPKARYCFKKAIDEGSKDAYVHYGYASMKLRQNMPGIAQKYATKAYGLDPLHARSRALAGTAMHAQGQSEEGLKLIELAHEMDDEDEQIWFQLESVRSALRERKERGDERDEEDEEDEG